MTMGLWWPKMKYIIISCNCFVREYKHDSHDNIKMGKQIKEIFIAFTLKKKKTLLNVIKTDLSVGEDYPNRVLRIYMIFFLSLRDSTDSFRSQFRKSLLINDYGILVHLKRRCFNSNCNRSFFYGKHL